LHLLRVLLLHLLRLLLVSLLGLLRLPWIGFLFRQLLMFLVLLLLELLPILVLLRRLAWNAPAGFSGPASRFPCEPTESWIGGSSLGWLAILAREVAVTGGAPWFAESLCWGLLRAAHAC